MRLIFAECSLLKWRLMIFLTVGTQFPFERLVKAVDEACGAGLVNEEIVAQVGDVSYQPKHFRAVATMPKEEYDLCFRQVSAVISHAGMGTISMALELNKPLLAMPRLARYGEVVNDHQIELADRFAGHILVARDESEIPRKIAELKAFVPVPRKAQPEAVAERVRRFLEEVLAG